MSTASNEQPIRYGEAEKTERPIGRSITRGMLNRCPHCGNGKLFRAFLKPVDNCAVCGEAMHHHRSDDLPPYLTIVVIGGTSLFGGRGTVLGSLIGALIVGVFRNGLTLAGLDVY